MCYPCIALCFLRRNYKIWICCFHQLNSFPNCAVKFVERFCFMSENEHLFHQMDFLKEIALVPIYLFPPDKMSVKIWVVWLFLQTFSLSKTEFFFQSPSKLKKVRKNLFCQINLVWYCLNRNVEERRSTIWHFWWVDLILHLSDFPPKMSHHDHRWPRPLTLHVACDPLVPVPAAVAATPQPQQCIFRATTKGSWMSPLNRMGRDAPWPPPLHRRGEKTTIN